MIAHTHPRRQLTIHPQRGGTYIESDDEYTRAIEMHLDKFHQAEEVSLRHIDNQVESAPASVFKTVAMPMPSKTRKPVKIQEADPIADVRKFHVCGLKAAGRCGLTMKQVKEYYYNRFGVSSLSEITPRQWAFIAAEAQAALNDVVLLDEWRRRVDEGTTLRIEFASIGYKHWDGSEWDAVRSDGWKIRIREKDIQEKGEGFVIVPGWYRRRIQEGV